MSAQVQKYAEYLGVNLQQYPELYSLMEAGLKAPLPAGWEIVQDGTSHYFVNNVSGQRQKDHPADDMYRQAARRQIQELGSRSPVASQVTPLRSRGANHLDLQNAGGLGSPSTSSPPNLSQARASGQQPQQQQPLSRRSQQLRTVRFVLYAFVIAALLHYALTAAIFKVYWSEGMPSLFDWVPTGMTGDDAAAVAKQEAEAKQAAEAAAAAAAAPEEEEGWF